jgi:hypothetical protein
MRLASSALKSIREGLSTLGGRLDISVILAFSHISKNASVSKLFSFHSSSSLADERSRLHGMHFAIKYFAGIWFVDTAKYHTSLSLNDSQIFKDSN